MSRPDDTKTINILLVEDSPTFVDLVGDMLAACVNDHFQLASVDSLREAAESLSQVKPDVVLLDLNLTDSHGLQTLRELRKWDQTTPVVVLTSAQTPHLDQAVVREGAQDFLGKDELNPRLLCRLLRFTVERAEYSRRLAMSENLNRRLIEHAQDIIYRIDLAGRFTFVNSASQAITGYLQEELLGKSFLELLAPQFRDSVMAHYLHQLKAGINATYLEFAIHTKNNQERWIGQHVWLAGSPESPTGLEAIARDITELKQALHNLEASRRQLEERVSQRTRELERAKLAWERTFDTVPDLIIITNTAMRITHVNRAVALRLGLSPDQIIGFTCGELIPGLASLDNLCLYGPEERENPEEYSREVRDEALNADLLVSTSRLFDEDGDYLGQVHVGRDITKQKQDEHMIKEQLRFLKVLVDAIPNPVFFKDNQGRYTGCNAAFEQFIGVTAAEIRGQDVSAVLPPEQAEFIARKDLELLRTGKVQFFETAITLPNGTQRDVINSKAVLLDSEGRLEGLVGVIQDISQLRAAERALRASEEQFRSLFEQAPISMWEEDFSDLKNHLDQLRQRGVVDLASYFEEDSARVLDAASLVRIINVNAYTLELFEAASKEELLTNLDKVLTEESLIGFQEELLALWNGTKNVFITAHNRTLKGKKIQALINVSLAPGAETTWKRVLITIQDVTERLKAQTALQESERRYRTLVEALNEGLVQVDEQANISFCNQRFTELTGYDKEELTGNPVFNLLDSENAARLRNQFALRKLGGHKSYELAFQAKNGPSVDTLVSPRPIFDHEGVFRGSFSLITDITDRKKLELQLRQSQKMEAIGQLAAGIAHEINTPTQYVASNSRFLQEGFGDLSKLVEKTQACLANMSQNQENAAMVDSFREFAEEIDLEFLMEEIPKALDANIEGLDRIAVIVRSMKDFAHPGKEEKQPVDLNQIIESTITVARNEWKYVAEVETDLDPKLPLVPCVSNEIKQVMLNILVNAAQAIGEVVTEGVDHKGTIRIGSRVENGQARITISDSGPGIPPAVAERVFDPFFTTKEPGKGTGQGLAIAYRAIVDNHHGALSLKSAEGKGTTFEIRLPLTEGERPQSQ